MRPVGSAAELERRRRHAVGLLRRGESPTTVARILGVARPTLYRWKRQAERPGGLDAKPHPGPAPRLSDDQLRELDGLLRQGAKAHGWHNQLWTAARVAALIDKEFGVRFHPRYLSAWLACRRITPQKPEKQARERDPAKVEAWLSNDWVGVKKKSRRGRGSS